MTYLFVYGSLRPAFRQEMHAFLVHHTDLLGTATFQGRLYDLGLYPGAVPSVHPEDRVTGEVFVVRPGSEGLVFQVLDRYEGCGPYVPGRPEYRREEVDVVLEDGQEVTAWMYVYNYGTEALTLIPSGDYVAYRCRT